MIARFDQPIEPMTLGNMRELPIPRARAAVLPGERH
jgi:hypothetical protein